MFVPRAEKIVRSSGRVVLLGIAIACTSGCFITSQARGEHAEWRKMVASPEQFGMRAETVSVVSADRINLRALWIAADSSASATVVLAHGQGGNRSYMLSRADFLVHHGYNAVVLDLRDCGESGGTYTTPGYMEAEDVLAGVRYAKSRQPGLPVAILGHSAGAVAVLHAGRSPDVAAIVSDAPFASYREMMKRVSARVQRDSTASRGDKFGMRVLVIPGMMAFAEWVFRMQTGISISPDRADARVAVHRLAGAPVLFIAGDRDSIATLAGVRELYEATPGNKKQLVILPASHNTFAPSHRSEYEAATLNFLSAAIRPVH